MARVQVAILNCFSLLAKSCGRLGRALASFWVALRGRVGFLAQSNPGTNVVKRQTRKCKSSDASQPTKKSDYKRQPINPDQ